MVIHKRRNEKKVRSYFIITAIAIAPRIPAVTTMT